MASERWVRWFSSSPFIALHVRTGDKAKEAKVYSMAEYEKALLDAVSLTGLRNVLMTGSLDDGEKQAFAHQVSLKKTGLVVSYIPSSAFEQLSCPANVHVRLFVE
eukprot:4020321-Pleurochrysis_carterae.AAC.1